MMAAGRSVRVQCRREPYSLLVEQRGKEGCITLHQDGAVQWSPPGQVTPATTGGLLDRNFLACALLLYVPSG